jgi:transposase-like protein
MLSPSRDADAAEGFFRQVLQASHTLTPRVITVDKNAAYPPAFESLQP